VVSKPTIHPGDFLFSRAFGVGARLPKDVCAAVGRFVPFNHTDNVPGRQRPLLFHFEVEDLSLHSKLLCYFNSLIVLSLPLEQLVDILDLLYDNIYIAAIQCCLHSVVRELLLGVP